MFNIWPFNILRKRREAAAKRRDEIAQRAFEDVERQRQARRAQEVLDTHRRMNQRLRATPAPPPFPPRPTRPAQPMPRATPSREQYNPARNDNMDDNLLLAAVLMQQNAVTPQYDEPRHRSDPEPCRSYSAPDPEPSRSSDSGNSSYSCDSGSSSSSDSGSSSSSGGGFD